MPIVRFYCMFYFAFFLSVFVVVIILVVVVVVVIDIALSDNNFSEPPAPKEELDGSFNEALEPIWEPTAQGSR